MCNNSKLLKLALAPFRVEALRPEHLLKLLSRFCKRISSKSDKEAALYALLLFKLGYYLYGDQPSVRVYLENAFKAHKLHVACSDPGLNGLLSLATDLDERPFDMEAIAVLRALVQEIDRRSAIGEEAQLRELRHEREAQETSPWARHSGNLSNDWFAHDKELSAAYEELNDLPSFVCQPSRRTMPVAP